MRMKPLPEKAQMILLSPILIPTAIFVLPALLMLPVMDWIEGKWKHRQLTKGLHRWFAWRPVRLRGLWFSRKDQYVWLEMVQRQYTNRDGWQYRFIGEVSLWDETDTPKGSADG